MITVTPFLWFDDDAAEAAALYQRVFPDFETVSATPGADGALFLTEVIVQGQHLVLLNGGPAHPHTDAFSLSVAVDGQAEIDRISDGLIGDRGEQLPCGWLHDAFGLSWQVVPSSLPRLLDARDADRAARVRQALLGMMRLDVAALHAAYEGR